MNKKMVLKAVLLINMVAAVPFLPRSRQRHFFAFNPLVPMV